MGALWFPAHLRAGTKLRAYLQLTVKKLKLTPKMRDAIKELTGWEPMATTCFSLDAGRRHRGREGDWQGAADRLGLARDNRS